MVVADAVEGNALPSGLTSPAQLPSGMMHSNREAWTAVWSADTTSAGGTSDTSWDVR